MTRWVSRGIWLFACAAALVYGQTTGDRALEYYRSGAEAALKADCPLWQSKSFTCKTISKYYRRDGKLMQLVDTAVATHFFTGAIRDSVKIAESSGEKSLRFVFDCPDVFSTEYLFNFYPNDTGGSQIALGFDSPNATDTLPVGVALITRDSKRPIDLFLYYPAKEDYRRFSRTLHFANTAGIIFPSDIVEIGVKNNFLSTETYRIDVQIVSVTLAQ